MIKLNTRTPYLAPSVSNSSRTETFESSLVTNSQMLSVPNTEQSRLHIITQTWVLVFIPTTIIWTAIIGLPSANPPYVLMCL